ncbi:NINE protein [Geminocystis sp. GBBB08]|uniref:NINE protein n=1 Tax=Geminocystis sp. GBBB08 TaxID=2604140 RepID=UPI0027E2F09B|nr:NINE protein [Geminocystis sp. GBBB08]MBL1210017.1 NINE protein [Geminocystis sp. GBBB08]
MVSKSISFLNQPKKRIFTVILALIGTITPLVGLHKFYLRQPLWGVIYLLISWQSPMGRIACAVDTVLYLIQDQEFFNVRFNSSLTSETENLTANPQQVTEIATALRELEKLRQEGLISEYEFEQKRRQLLV